MEKARYAKKVKQDEKEARVSEKERRRRARERVVVGVLPVEEELTSA